MDHTAWPVALAVALVETVTEPELVILADCPISAVDVAESYCTDTGKSIKLFITGMRKVERTEVISCPVVPKSWYQLLSAVVAVSDTSPPLMTASLPTEMLASRS